MQKIKVSVVSYANSVPFVYGLLNSEVSNDINLSLDVPSVCADKILSGEADIGLIPIVEILRMKEYEIVSELCIGAIENVRTVILASDVPIHNLSKIYLDYQSRTSVILVKVLAKYHWNIHPEWISAKQGFETEAIYNSSGAVIIGDRTFSVQTKYRYDLAYEWNLFTGLPFVFAAWVSNKKLDKHFKTQFNNALSYGVQNMEASVQLCQSTHTAKVDILDYLKKNISFNLDASKRKAIGQFLEYAREFVDGK